MFLITKKEGETPLEALEAHRALHSELKNIPLSYAGRLDPMASGLLLILEGEENKDRGKYLEMDKEYEFEILLGFETDTHDILGIPKKGGENNASLEALIPQCIGPRIQEYPAFSSKTVDGIPLHAHTRAGREVEIPTKEVTIYSLKKIGDRTLSGEEMLRDIEERVGRVTGDFRQAEVVEGWRDLLVGNSEHYRIATLHVVASSGTYVRKLAHDMGRALGGSALAYSIRRTRIGEWRL